MPPTLNNLKPIGPTAIAPPPLTTKVVQVPLAPQPKQKSKAGKLFQKLGGAEGIINGVAGLTASASTLIANSKKKANTTNETEYPTGGQETPASNQLFGMPSIAAYTAIAVVGLIIAFIAYKLATRK